MAGRSVERYMWVMASELVCGDVVAGYRIDGVLGRGGMGCVYRATQLKLERAVALKVIAAPFAGDQMFRERFRREGLAAASIDHPHVLPVFEADEWEGMLFLSMRLVEGHSLAELIGRDGRLDPATAVRLMSQVAAGLDAAHARGVVHRDVKPANVLIADTGGREHAYLTDFGIARRGLDEAVTVTGQVVGTLNYVAPEVLRGESPDASGDIYALGCLVFEALTGEVPYLRGTHEAMVHAHLFEPVPSARDRGADVPCALDAVVQWALAKRPDERPDHAGALVAPALEALSGAPAVSRTTQRGRTRGPDVAHEAAGESRRRRHNLTVEPSTVIGRERELADVRALLRSSRLVTLSGAGGAGKTRLANGAAAEMLDAFPDGVWLVELAALDASELVPSLVAEALGLRDEAGRPWVDQLGQYLAGRELLIVLDNCEHVLAECARLADRLVRSCPGIAILATSREPLGIVGEKVYRVPSLSVPSPNDGPDEIMQADAVRLFSERAGEHGSGFVLSEDNAAAVAAVCRRVDGMPLAIELAAARTRSLSVRDIAARLDQRFTLLTGGSSTAPPRQQTLRATVEWSFELLGEPARELLRRLSVFPGDFDLDAAEAVCTGDGIADSEVLDLVASLVDKSLVQMVVGRAGSTRYRLLETIRRYASEQLANAGENRLRAMGCAHAQHYLHRAQAIAPELIGADQVTCLDLLQADYDNLRAALEFAAHAADPRAGLQLVASLGLYWERRGPLAEGAGLIARALDHPHVDGAPAGDRAGACLAGASVAALRDYRQQIDYAERALEQTEGPDAARERSLALTHRAIATVLGDAGDFETAARDAECAMDLARKSGDPWLIARAAQTHAHVQFAAGDLAACLAWQEEALAAYRRTADAWRVARLLTNSGDFKLAAGDRDGGRRDLEEALELTGEIRAHELRAVALHNLALFDLADGDHVSAHAHAHEAFTLAGEIGAWGTQADAVLDLAVAAGTRGRDLLAAALVGVADALRHDEGLQIHEQRLRDTEIERLKATLGETTFDAAHRKGTTLSARDAGALAEEAS
jgi:predicted ATPase